MRNISVGGGCLGEHFVDTSLTLKWDGQGPNPLKISVLILGNKPEKLTGVWY